MQLIPRPNMYTTLFAPPRGPRESWYHAIYYSYLLIMMVIHTYMYLQVCMYAYYLWIIGYVPLYARTVGMTLATLVGCATKLEAKDCEAKRLRFLQDLTRAYSHTHTHTHIYIHVRTDTIEFEHQYLEYIQTCHLALLDSLRWSRRDMFQ